jgi:hypothetical protein
MDEIIFFVFILFSLFALIGFYKIFTGIYIGYLINQGLYKNRELDDFPLNLTSEEEYTSILEKINFFSSQIIEGVECSLSINGDELNCLAYKGLTPVKPYILTSKTGLLFYSFEFNKLFEEEISYAGPDGVFYGKREILIDFRISSGDVTRPAIFIKKKFYYPEPPSNKLEEWARKKEEEAAPIVSYIYRSNFILSIFNSDLSFTREEITNILKKVSLLEIVDYQLVFTADPNNQISYD